MTDPNRYVGTVGIHTIGRGSRYEHDAIYIEIEDEDTKLELRTPGKSAFQQEEFAPFIGRHVAVTGYLVEEHLLFVTQLESLENKA